MTKLEQRARELCRAELSRLVRSDRHKGAANPEATLDEAVEYEWRKYLARAAVLVGYDHATDSGGPATIDAGVIRDRVADRAGW